MKTEIKLPFLTLILLISFASVNAVLFTPSLPNLAQFFGISSDSAQQTMTVFLVGYALGQLVYGPIANRFGRKSALYAGISIQIISSLLCVLAGLLQEYSLLLIGRFLLALGSGVGLNMTITLVMECYDPKTAAQKISYIILAFAITPGLSVALGGIVNTYYGWMGCFYAGAIYGFLLLLLVTRLPETLKTPNLDALKIKKLLNAYAEQFKSTRLIGSGLILGGMTAFVYVFASMAPFIAIKGYGMSSEEYGLANLLPPVGLFLGALFSAQLAKRNHSPGTVIQRGILITAIGVFFMLISILLKLPPLFFLFFPMIIIYFGTSFLPAHVSAMVMGQITDKANASAIMSFINMGFATLVALNIGFFPVSALALPIVYFILSGFMFGVYKWLMN